MLLPLLVPALLCLLTQTSTGDPGDMPEDPILQKAGPVASRLIEAALESDEGWRRLAYLTDTFPHRLSGSKGLEGAIDWSIRTMRRDGFENVRAEKVLVPHWVRGRESAAIVSPAYHELRILGLGGSVATPPEGVEAEVIVLADFDDLEKRAADVKGKIVLFNVPFSSYGQAVPYRTQGAARAGRLGAVAHLVRSVTPTSLDSPHTGAMHYEEGVPRIPSAAVTVEAAQMMQRMRDRGEKVVLRLKLEAQARPDAESASVVAEIVGRDRPSEVIVLGGHLDAWDVGTGAMDDAGGCLVTWEAMRLIKALELRPRRTLRLVLFTNEENGLRGGTAYRDAHMDELGNHVLAIEFDHGVFQPHGFGFEGSVEALALIQRAAPLLERIGSGNVRKGGGGPDISPLLQVGVPGMSPWFEDTDYFDYHHSYADTIDKIDPQDFATCVAATAAMAFVVADLEERLPSQVTASKTGSR